MPSTIDKTACPSSIKMLSALHPDAARGLVEGGFIAGSVPDLEKNIGRTVRFINWTESMGTLKRDHMYTIIGVQKVYDGRVAYRVTCNGFDDTFGCPARPEEVEFTS